MNTNATGFVPFNGVQIPYVFDGETYWIAITTIAETLGLNVSSAHKSLKNLDFEAQTWLIQPCLGADKKVRDMVCVNFDYFNFWLCNIQIGKVKEESRLSLKKYKAECAKVLKEHFFGKVQRQSEGKLAYQNIARIKIRLSELKELIEASPEGQELKALRGELKREQIVLYKLVDEQYGGEQLFLGM